MLLLTKLYQLGTYLLSYALMHLLNQFSGRPDAEQVPAVVVAEE